MVAKNRFASPEPFPVASPSGVSAALPTLPYFLTPGLYLFNILCFLCGGHWLWLPVILAVLIYTLLEEKLGDSSIEPVNPPIGIFYALYYLMLPLLFLCLTLLLHFFTLGDPLGLVAGLAAIGIDFEGARKATEPGDLVVAVCGQGFFSSLSLGAVHELSHQTAKPTAMLASRVIGAFSFDPWMSIYHAHGHHIRIGLFEDTATARRGETVYRFLIRNLLGAQRFSYNFEKNALRRRNIPFWSLHNRFLGGWLFFAMIVLYAAMIAGFAGVLAFLAVTCQSRLYLAVTEYIQHYGLVRAPGEAVDARFSWDVYRLVTNATLFNAARHADHHCFAARPGGLLRLNEKAPHLAKGYVALIAMAMVPPIYMRFMESKLADWDLNFATPEEIAYMRANNIPHATTADERNALSADRVGPVRRAGFRPDLGIGASAPSR